MSLSALQEYIRLSKYARYLPEHKRRETWDEQVDRVFGMHRYFFSDYLQDISDDIDFAEQMMRDKRVLGSQRILQFGGDPVLEKPSRVFNCWAGYIDKPRAFQEYMYLLLCGGGVGFSIQKHHVEKLPEIGLGMMPKKTFVVPDTIEGWADALGVLISSFIVGDADVPFPEYQGYDVEFDYSQIRPKGAPISSGSKAPGPDGLRRSLEKIRDILLDAVGSNRKDRNHAFTLRSTEVVKLRPIQVYDILMHASDAVISGGVRRSATIALFSPDDEEMIKAKTGDWAVSNPQRGRSNNSAVLVRGQTTYDEFHQFIEWTKEYGEPGFFWTDSTEIVANPCVEISLHPVDMKTGQTGWQPCNLSEINGKKAKTEEQFLQACKAGAILGTLQAAYTDFNYLHPVNKRIADQEALLGVSITGMMDNPALMFDEELQRKGAQLIKKVNEELAEKIGINKAARTTCIKPSGTASKVLGTASGIHPHHASRYMRRVQANEEEAPAQYFEMFNPRAVEESVWDPNGVTKVITFVCEVPKGAKLKNQLSALEMLKKVHFTQDNWVIEGTRPENCTIPGIRHNVSNTVVVKENEWEDVAHYIYDNRAIFAGVSLLPHSGDKDYPQAPECAVRYPRDILFEYGEGAFFASGLITSAIEAYGDLWFASSSLLGTGEAPAVMKQRDWCKRATKYANRYFDGDLRKMTYCLKDIYNLKLWEDLNREYVDVPWESMLEEDDTVDFNMEAACAGGTCELPPEYLDALRGK